MRLPSTKQALTIALISIIAVAIANRIPQVRTYLGY